MQWTPCPSIDGSKFKPVKNRERNFLLGKIERCERELESHGPAAELSLTSTPYLPVRQNRSVPIGAPFGLLSGLILAHSRVCEPPPLQANRTRINWL